MKKWYCPHCGVFKSFKKVFSGYMGYPDTYHCWCCNTELINVKKALKYRDEQYIKELAKKREDSK